MYVVKTDRQYPSEQNSTHSSFLAIVKGHREKNIYYKIFLPYVVFFQWYPNR